MTDVVNPAKRSRMMAGIRSKNTKGELLLRKRLTALGYRYRLHRRDLPGTPDLVLGSRRAVIFFHGCFWHWHKCHLSKMPSSNVDFWKDKLARNVRNDRRAKRELRKQGWRVLEVWECSFRGVCEAAIETKIRQVDAWLRKGRLVGR